MSAAAMPTLLDGAFLRTARKQYRCCAPLRDENGRWIRRQQGAMPVQVPVRCHAEIRRGDRYVEYVGETPLYQSGDRYCLACARSEGLLS